MQLVSAKRDHLAAVLRRYWQPADLPQWDEHDLAERAGAEKHPQGQRPIWPYLLELRLRRQRSEGEQDRKPVGDGGRGANDSTYHKILLRRYEIGSGEKRRHHRVVRLR